MARRQCKQWWTQFVPKLVERSTYVLLAPFALILLFWQWRPMPTVVWHIDNPQIAMAITGLGFAGWLLVLSSTFLINHFELFGPPIIWSASQCRRRASILRCSTNLCGTRSIWGSSSHFGRRRR
jgi:protein-S-isoprenylcysteine O-methyltransferase Ste14